MMTSTEPPVAAPDCALCTAAPPANAQAQSALQITREALTRWRGNARPAGLPARDLTRVSPQARWMAEARYGLAAWIAGGGFAQDDALAADLAAPRQCRGDADSADIDTRSDACIE